MNEEQTSKLKPGDICKMGHQYIEIVNVIHPYIQIRKIDAEGPMGAATYTYKIGEYFWSAVSKRNDGGSW
jgi:hypothetical protein